MSLFRGKQLAIPTCAVVDWLLRTSGHVVDPVQLRKNNVTVSSFQRLGRVQQGRPHGVVAGAWLSRSPTWEPLHRLVAVGRFLVGGALPSSGARAPQLPTFSEEPSARMFRIRVAREVPCAGCCQR